MIKGIQKTSLVDYEPYTVSTIFTGGCNFKCPYCQNPNLVRGFEKQSDINEDEVISFLVSRKKWLDGICITGGEPCIHDVLPDFIKKVREKLGKNFKVKLDTNGTNPEMLEKIPEPTNLYISVDSPRKADYLKLDRPMVSGTWEALNRSLDLLKNFKCNTVVRITLMRENLKNPAEFGKFLEKYSPKFIECKSFMHVGFSKDRVEYGQMPLHEEIMAYAGEMENNTKYKLVDSKQESRVALLKLQ